MAWYKHSKYISVNNHANFDNLHSPGDTPGDAGIFRCNGCGKEIGHTKSTALPPQNHHQHTTAQGKIQWRMVVCAENEA